MHERETESKTMCVSVGVLAYNGKNCVCGTFCAGVGRCFFLCRWEHGRLCEYFLSLCRTSFVFLPS